MELSRAVGDNEEVRHVVDNVVAITADARGFTGEFRVHSRDILMDARAVVRNVKDIIGDNEENVQSGFEGIKGAVGRLQGALDTFDQTLKSTRSIAQKIDEGDGTLGQLVNDGRLAENVNALLEESNQFVKKLTRLQTVVGMRSDVYAQRGTVRNAFELRLMPKPDKYYMLSLIDDPRGRTRFRETVTNTSASDLDPVIRESQTVTEDRFRVSLRFARGSGLLRAESASLKTQAGSGSTHTSWTITSKSPRISLHSMQISILVSVCGPPTISSAISTSRVAWMKCDLELRDAFLGLGFGLMTKTQAILTATPTPSF